MSELAPLHVECGEAGQPTPSLPVAAQEFKIGVIPGDPSSIHTKDIVLDSWGLFDPRSLLPYMAQDRCAQLLTPQLVGSCKQEYHHGLFTKKAFKNDTVHWALKRVRGSRYNQFLMWSCQEDLFHQDSVNEVPIEDLNTEAAERFTEEEDILDRYAASSLALAEAQNESENSTNSFFRVKRAMLAANLALHQELNESAEQKLHDIEVMSFEVVTGALLTYFNRQPEAGLERILRKRLEDNPTTIATKGHNPKHLRDLSKRMVDGKISTSSFQLRALVEAARAA